MNNLIAYFNDAEQAGKVIGALTDHGVDKDHISCITGEDNLDKLYTSEAAKEAREKSKGVTTTTKNDAATGALKGTGIGLGAGALAGLASLFIPGYGLVFGSGALLTASLTAAGTGAAGALSGAVAGYLKDQGIDESLVGEYTEALENAGAIVGVEVSEDSVSESKIRDLFKKYQGAGISRTRAIMSATTP